MNCYREPSNGAYFGKGQHWGDCNDSACRGCTACTERHCTAKKSCGNHLSDDELTCARCLGRARANLRRITDLAPLALADPERDRTTSEVVNLAGPVADPVTWDFRQRRAKDELLTANRAGHLSDRGLEKAWLELDTEDERHPGNLLPRWAKMLAEDYGLEYGVLTMSSASERLDRLLARVAQDPEQDFPLLAGELRACRDHLEQAFRTEASARPPRGVPCPDCTNPATGLGPRLVREFGHWCEDPDCQRLHYADDSGDRWVCPRNKGHEWTVDAYERHLVERAS